MNLVKKYQRKVNRTVKNLNKSLWEDSLFPKRFVISQKMRGSGDYISREWYDMVYVFEIKDVKTNEVKEFSTNNFNYSHTITWEVNNFIVNIRKRENW